MSPPKLGAVLFLLAACSGVRSPGADTEPARAPAPAATAEVVAHASQPAPKPAAIQMSAGWIGAPPQWVWSSPNPGASEVVVLERAFEVPRPTARATLRASADNRLRVYLNGELVGEHAEWSDALVQDVGAEVRRGENVLTLIARNDGGQAGAWAELVVEDESGKRVRVVTDGSWLASSLPDDALFEHASPEAADRSRVGPAHASGAFGVAPWSSAVAGPRTVATAVPDEVGGALAASEIQVPPGFRVDLVYEVPRATQGSWVALCEDPRGRFYVSDQHGRLFRVTPAALGAAPTTTRVEPVDVDIGSAHGLCWAFDALYVVVAERDPGRVCGLYRLRDTDGDDRLDSSEMLRELAGHGEHGPHAVRLGPDGASLWLMAGNHTDLPADIVRSRVPRTWAEDILLPRIDDPNGHAVGRMAPGGWLARMDRDGANFEIVSAGYRNAYDFAFEARSGEAFTFDSDMEWDVGAPWYRETRIVHAASGTEFGWRAGSGKWASDYVDTWPSACDLGRTSPTGVEFGTHARFPEKYRRALYAADWSFGTIHAVHLEPDGASWRGRAENFAHGEPFQVTDLMVARDGALYVTTGGRNTRSALYRIAWTGALDEQAGAPRAEPPISVAQKRRRELEQLHVAAPRTPTELDAIARGLMSQDRFMAGAARVALEFTPVEQWDVVWSRCQDSRAAARIVVAALHAGHPDRARMLGEVERLIVAENDPSLPRIEALRLAQLALIRGNLPVEMRSVFATRLVLDFAGGDARVARESAMVLAYLDAPGIVDGLLARIDASTTQEDAIHYAYCLRVVKSGWTRASRVRFLDFFDERGGSFRGGESLAKFVTRIRDDFVSNFTAEERTALAERLTPPKPAAAAAVVAATATFVRRWSRPELEALLAAPLAGRSFEGGRDAYAKSTCIACHRIGDAGGATGPDLTSTASRFGVADMLDAILEPSKTISDQYRDVELRTVDGDLLVGRVESEKNGAIRLRRAPSDEVVDIAESDVEMRRPYPLSRMPSGLLDTLDEAAVLDLFAYLRSGGSPEHAAFRR